MGKSSSSNSNYLICVYKSKIKIKEKEYINKNIIIDEKKEEKVYNKIKNYLNSFNKKERLEIKRNFRLKYGFKFDIKILSIILSNKQLFKQFFFSNIYRETVLEHIDDLIREVKNPKEYTPEEIENFLKKVRENFKKLNKEKGLTYLLRPIYYAELPIIGYFVRKHASKEYTDGALHAALSLSGKIIDWGNCSFCNSLVIPSPHYNQIFNVSFELEESFWKILGNFFYNIFVSFVNFFINIFNPEWRLRTVYEREIDDIIDICINYNINNDYNYENKNCQSFVREILKKLDFKLETIFKGEMKRELNYLKENGKLDFNFKNNHFEIRKQLDEFMKKCNLKKLKNDDKKLLFLYKSSFETMKKCKEENGELTEENKGKYETTEEAEKFWQDLALKEKLG